MLLPCPCLGAWRSLAAISACWEPEGLHVPLLPSLVATLVVAGARWQTWVVPHDTGALLEGHVVSCPLSPAMNLGASQSRV